MIHLILVQVGDITHWNATVWISEIQKITPRGTVAGDLLSVEVLSSDHSFNCSYVSHKLLSTKLDRPKEVQLLSQPIPRRFNQRFRRRLISPLTKPSLPPSESNNFRDAPNRPISELDFTPQNHPQMHPQRTQQTNFRACELTVFQACKSINPSFNSL